MEFMGIGYQELIVVMVLLLVVVGPERLPTVAYQVGRAVRQMQRYARAVRDEFSEELGFLDEQLQNIKGETSGLSDSLRSAQGGTLPSLGLSGLLGLPSTPLLGRLAGIGAPQDTETQTTAVEPPPAVEEPASVSRASGPPLIF